MATIQGLYDLFITTYEKLLTTDVTQYDPEIVHQLITDHNEIYDINIIYTNHIIYGTIYYGNLLCNIYLCVDKTALVPERYVTFQPEVKTKSLIIKQREYLAQRGFTVLPGQKYMKKDL